MTVSRNRGAFLSRIPVRLAWFTVLTVAVPLTATAQFDEQGQDVDTPGLVVEAAAGWDGTVDLGTAVPISFLITNHSTSLVKGQLRLYDRVHGHEVDLGEVHIAPGTARRVTSIQSMGEWMECFAALRDGAKILWRRELALRTGRDFSPSLNFALFIADGGRSLQLPGAVSDVSTLGSDTLLLGSKKGRPVQCLTVKSWQVPNHFGPLVVAQAMIFREGMDESALNRVQWKAVGEWLCQGGTVFVHEKSRELIDHLVETSPLKSGAPIQSGEFTIRGVGLGAIHEYSQPLFDSAGNGTRKQIADTIARLPKQHIISLVELGDLYSSRDGRADRNRILVVAFFGFYTFLSGFVALLLFRLTQRRIAGYTVVIVTGGCVLSGLLGGLLRFSQGDLRWMTVTQAGAGGAVQVARIEVQSAGGRNTQVAVTGGRPDLQFTGNRRRYYYSWNSNRSSTTRGFPSFTWQRNRAPDRDNSYQVDVPMTPWGSRMLHATAFNPDVPRLGFRLNFNSGSAVTGQVQPQSEAQAEPPAQTSGTPSGTVSLMLRNHLPYDLTECWLLIGATHDPAGQVTMTQPAPLSPGLPPGIVPTVQGQTNGLIDVYHMERVANLAAGESHESRFPVEFKVLQNNWEFHRSWRGGSLTLPRISRLGTASAWIVGRLTQSPGLSIDREHGDFVPQEELHLYFQEILPEDLTGLTIQ